MSDAEAVAWLREQITDRLEKARSATAGPWAVDVQNLRGFRVAAPDGSLIAASVRMWSDGSPGAAHIALNDPQDVIARCEAELGILGLCDLWIGEAASEHPSLGAAACAVSDAERHLASAYRHREGYKEHWAPPTR